MIQQRVKETLCLAAARPRGYQCSGCQPIAGEPLPGRFLMHETGMFRFKTIEEPLSMGSKAKRQTDLDVGPLHPTGFILREAPHDAVEERI